MSIPTPVLMRVCAALRETPDLRLYEPETINRLAIAAIEAYELAVSLQPATRPRPWHFQAPPGYEVTAFQFNGDGTELYAQLHFKG